MLLIKRALVQTGAAAFDSIYFVQKGNTGMDVYRGSLYFIPKSYIDFLFIFIYYFVLYYLVTVLFLF